MDPRPTREEKLYAIIRDLIPALMSLADQPRPHTEMIDREFNKRYGPAEKAGLELCNLRKPNIWKLIHIMQWLPTCRTSAWKAVQKYKEEEKVRMVFWHCRRWKGGQTGYLVPRQYIEGMDVSEAAGKWLLEHCRDIAVITNVGAYVPALEDQASERVEELKRGPARPPIRETIKRRLHLGEEGLEAF